jgi:flagella basal body P-ring formation protein FlgA
MTWMTRVAACLLGMLPVVAQAQQDPAAIQSAVASFVRLQLAGQPGTTRVEVGAIDPSLRLERCQRLEAFVPPGARLWGNSTVGVRCAAGGSWTIYVPATVHVEAPAVVAARPLANGKLLQAGDLALQTLDLTQLPPGVLTDLAQAVGKTLTVGLMPGYPIRQDMLRAPLVIRQGQSVRLVAKGGGFAVSAEGKALGNAAEGQPVQVRTQNGQTVSGIAKSDGSVEVNF